MYQFIMLFHVMAAACIIALVLVQQGKGATMGAGFGSGASQTVFGSRGSGSFLFRVTIGFVAVFFITSIYLNYIAVNSYKQHQAFELPISNGQSIPVNSNTNVKNNKTTDQPIQSTETSPVNIPARQ